MRGREAHLQACNPMAIGLLLHLLLVVVLLVLLLLLFFLLSSSLGPLLFWSLFTLANQMGFSPLLTFYNDLNHPRHMSKFWWTSISPSMGKWIIIIHGMGFAWIICNSWSFWAIVIAHRSGWMWIIMHGSFAHQLRFKPTLVIRAMFRLICTLVQVNRT